MKDILIYTGPGCAECDQAKGLLRHRGFDYREQSLAEAGVIDEFRERLPRAKALPQIFVEGEHIGGLEDLRLRLHVAK
jgi:glutaredoxin